MELKNKTVIVTGSSDGIGKETAMAFAKEGANVVVTYNTNEKGARKTIAECKKFGVESTYEKLDVRDLSSIKEFSKKIFNKVDILVNNAGIVNWENLKEQSYDEIENQIDTNLKGLMMMTKAFLDELAPENEEAIIINVSSGAGKQGYSGLSTYCGTKFGVRGFTQALAGELPSNVKIFSVNPGMTATKMTNYSGTDAKNVADVIVKAASGKIRPDRNLDVDVWEYV